MRIGSPWPHKKARIEIIPLIDIMFFLLASFMLASLSMIRLQSLKMNLPTATVAGKSSKPPINLLVKKSGDIWVENKPINIVDLQHYLADKLKADTNVSVYITGEKEAKHGRMIMVLDLVRQVGIGQVSFDVSPVGGSKS